MRVSVVLAAVVAVGVGLSAHAQDGTSRPATAAVAEAVPPGRAVVGARSLEVSTGEYRASFDKNGFWTLRSVSYRGKPLLISEGWYQTVVNIKEQGFVGTGHGGEKLESVEVVADGKSHLLAEGLELQGRQFLIRRKTWIGPYYHVSQVTVSPGGLVEDFHYEIRQDDSAVNHMYAFMHCWSAGMDRWTVGLAEGQEQSGTFLSDGSNTLMKDIRWLLIYSARDQVGAVYAYPEIYKGGAFKNGGGYGNTFRNRPKDRKLYFCPDLPRGIGQTFRYQVAIRAFAAPEPEWENTGRSVLAELTARSPESGR